MSLLITTIVGGDLYLNFAPIYIYSIKKSYPDYNIKIYSWDKINNNIKNILKLIKADDLLIEKDFSIYENNPNIIKTIRFLYDYEDIKNYDCVFVGDIDFFICKENPSLLDHHLDRCTKNNLCYSNKIRRDTLRLTGLHFFKVLEYHNKCYNIIEEYKNKFKKKEYDFFDNLPYSDEELLYLIAARSGLGFPENIEEKRLHHGIHLKRNYSQVSMEKELELKEYSDQFIDSYENDDIFKEVLSMISKDARKYIDECYKDLK